MSKFKREPDIRFKYAEKSYTCLDFGYTYHGLLDSTIKLVKDDKREISDSRTWQEINRCLWIHLGMYQDN